MVGSKYSYIAIAIAISITQPFSLIPPLIASAGICPPGADTHFRHSIIVLYTVIAILGSTCDVATLQPASSNDITRRKHACTRLN